MTGHLRGKKTELSIRNLVVNVQQVDSAKAMLMKRQKEVEKASPVALCFFNHVYRHYRYRVF